MSSAPADDADAAAKIAEYMKCMRAKIKTSGKGSQNAEMLLCSKTRGKLSIEDYGGWALRNESISRMLRELDAELPDFAPILIQTGDRCIAKRVAGGVELDLWQSQPVPEELRVRLPLRRIVSMCSSPKYCDVPIPDWCFDAWPEGGVPLGGYDDACAKIAAAGALPPTDGANLLSWCGTAHHHPSRMRLVELAKAHPNRLAVNNVVGEAKDQTTAKAQHRSLIEQIERCGYLLDVQGKGYSSRLKLLLFSGRCVFIASRPWQEYYSAGLVPWRHYVPVKEDLSDLLQVLDWADTHPDEVSAIARASQAFARLHLTKDAAMRCLKAALITTSKTEGNENALVKGAAWREAASREDWLQEPRTSEWSGDHFPPLPPLRLGQAFYIYITGSCLCLFFGVLHVLEVHGTIQYFWLVFAIFPLLLVHATGQWLEREGERAADAMGAPGKEKED